MQDQVILVESQHVQLSDAIRGHAQQCILAVDRQYMGRLVEAHVVFSRDADIYKSVIKLKVGSFGTINAESYSRDIYAAFDLALDRARKRLAHLKSIVRDNKPKHPGKDRFLREGLGQRMPHESSQMAKKMPREAAE